MWKYAQSVAVSELDDTDPGGFDKVDKEKVEQTIAKIDAALKDKPVSKQVNQKLNYAKKHWPAALNKYEQQEKTMGEHRKSFSKTDPDATFMRMKEDHMKKGLLKPAYNVQISSNNQYITHYSSTSQQPILRPFPNTLMILSNSIKPHPDVLTADAGYGSEANYQ